MRWSERAGAMALAAAMVAGCGDRATKAEPGAVGTSGRSGETVSAAFGGGTPAFVGRDAEGVRLWKLTRQFYQKRGDAFAWIDDRKPRREMEALAWRSASSIARGSCNELLMPRSLPRPARAPRA